jgi:hypothetical protein
MRFLKMCVMLVLVVLGLSLSGCCGGGSEKVVEKETVLVPKEAAPPTLGKQLEDLKDAYEKGAITKGEYEEGKRRLLGQ